MSWRWSLGVRCALTTDPGGWTRGCSGSLRWPCPGRRVGFGTFSSADRACRGGPRRSGRGRPDSVRQPLSVVVVWRANQAWHSAGPFASGFLLRQPRSDRFGRPVDGRDCARESSIQIAQQMRARLRLGRQGGSRRMRAQARTFLLLLRVLLLPLVFLRT